MGSATALRTHTIRPPRHPISLRRTIAHVTSCRYDRRRKQVAPLQVLLPLDPPDGDHSRDEGPHAESARVGPAGLQSTGAPNPAPPAKEHTMGHHTLRIADGSAPRRRPGMAGAALPRAPAAPGPRTAPAAPRSESGLMDLIIDQIGRLEPAFDPDVTEYTATAYRSLETITVYPITTDDGASATVNGSAPDPEAHDRVSMDLELGDNTLTVLVDNGERTTEYTVTITKVDTDFRGRELVTGLTATSPVGEAEGRPLSAMFDGDVKTSWHPAEPLAAGEPDEEGVTTFTIKQPEVRTAGRVSEHVLTPEWQWYPSEWETYLYIDLSEDGDSWERAAHHATLRQDQDILYWELGDYYSAQYVRITLAGKDDRLHEKFGVQEIQVFALPAGVEPPERHEPPADGGQESAYVP